MKKSLKQSICTAITAAALGGAMGASLKNAVALAMSTESKRFRQRMQGDAAVAAEMRTALEAEEAHQRERRVEFQAEMACSRWSQTKKT